MKYPISRASLIALVLGVVVSYGQAAGGGSPNDRFFSHVYGAVAGAYIGNGLGEPTEDFTWQQIEQKYGYLDKFVPSEKRLKQDTHTPQRFGPEWITRGYNREPGWSEDGMERYKLLAAAVIEKGGRVEIEDLARSWVQRIDETKFGYHLGEQDHMIYRLLKDGVPPYDVGRYTPWPGTMGVSKMAEVFGIVNACRPDNAARDALAVSRIKDYQGLTNDFALENSAAIAAATAEALCPGATVDSVIQAALAQLPDMRNARKEVQGFLDATKNAKDYKELRLIYADRYKPTELRYPVPQNIEILAGGLASFRLAKGDPREAVLIDVNIARNTDCTAYVAGGLAGALKGVEAWPAEWLVFLEKSILTDPYTVDKRNAHQMAEGLYKAALNEHAKAKAANTAVDSLLAK